MLRFRNGVVIIEGRDIEKTNIHTVAESCPIYVENLKVHLLVKGCVFDIATSKLTVPQEETC